MNRQARRHLLRELRGSIIEHRLTEKTKGTPLEQRGLYYGPDGKPISMPRWTRLVETRDRHLASDRLPSGAWVSTIWLGIDHSFGLGGPPLIFETMVFASKRARDDLDCRRYSSPLAAKKGHMEMVAKWWNLPVPKQEDGA